MECCRILVEHGGADLAANQPNDAFRKWCANNPDETLLVVSSAKAGNELAKRFATFAIQASNDVQEAVDFITRFDDERRLFGMAALAGMSFTDGNSVQQAVQTLEPLVSSAEDDNVRANALHAAFDLFKRTKDSEAAGRLAIAASQQSGPLTLHCLTHVIWLHHQLLNDEAFEAAIAALERVPPENLGTIRDLDMALHRLLGTPRERLALSLLTGQLADGKLTLENFQTTASELRRGEPKRLYELIVGWLLSGNLAVCENVNHLIRFGEKHHFEANVASSEFHGCRTGFSLP